MSEMHKKGILHSIDPSLRPGSIMTDVSLSLKKQEGGIGGQAGQAGPKSIMGPQCKQTAGKPYVFYHKIGAADTKPTGVRMSACFTVMDNCRNDMFTICDMTVDSMSHVENPMVECSMELMPDILMLSSEEANTGPGRGLLYRHKRSTSTLQQWLRLEAKFGWGTFPMRGEEQTIYLVGKDKSDTQRIPVAKAMFIEAFLDKDLDGKPGGGLLQGENWVQDMHKFWENTMYNHSDERLAERQLSKMYPSSGEPITPTDFAKVTWTMPFGYADIWGILYHARTPEILWDANMKAGGVFADLVENEPDPQALAINLPKKMAVGTVYEIFMFLDKPKKKAVYILLEDKATEFDQIVLCVTANYRWKGIPADGSTLTKEDFDVLTGPSRQRFFSYGLNPSAEVQATKFVDLSKLGK